MPSKNCVIDGCTNTISTESKHNICALCRHGLYYWNKKRPAQVLERRRKLKMYNSRLETLIRSKHGKT